MFSNNICSPPKRGRPQVRLPIKTRGRLNSSFSSRGQRQDPGRYTSRSQQSTPKTTVSSKPTGRSLRKIKSAPPTEMKSLRIASRSTRQSHGPLQADVFVELLSPRRKGRGRKSANNTPENSPNFSNYRVIATKSSEQSRSPNVASKLSLQDSDYKRRGRKRQCTGMKKSNLNYPYLRKLNNLVQRLSIEIFLIIFVKAVTKIYRVFREQPDLQHNIH